MPGKALRLAARHNVTIVLTLALILLPTVIISPVHSAGDYWNSKNPMPSPRTYSGMTSLNGRIYLIGGIDIPGNILGSNNAYDPASDIWTSLAPLPVPTDLAGVVAAEGLVYAIGGLSWHGNKNYAITAAVEAYNPQTNSWTNKTSLPYPMESLMVTTVNGLIYIMGGESLLGPQNSTWVYNPQNDTWREKAAMPAYDSSLGRAPNQVATVAGKIYVFDQSEGSIGPGRPISPMPMFNLVYDPSTDIWAHWPALTYTGARGNPITLAGHSMISLGTSIYVIGGNDAGLWCSGKCATNPGVSQLTHYNFEYDTLSGNWTRRADMLTGRAGLVLAEVGGIIYAMGGETDTSSSVFPLTTGYTDHNEAYTPCSGVCPAFEPAVSLPYLTWTLEGIAVVGVLGTIVWGIWIRTRHAPLRPLDSVNWRTQNRDKDQE